jgi:hypothetical protein
MQPFHNYVSNILNDTNSADAVLLNGHTTFLMCNEDKRDQINDHRMNWFVNTYDSPNKQELSDYYKDNIKDTYSGIFDPPPCFYNETIRKERENSKLLEEEKNDDVYIHYEELEYRHMMNVHIMNKLSNNDEYDNNDIPSSYLEDEDNDTNSVVNDSEYYASDVSEYNEFEDYESEYEEDDFDF